MEDSHSCVSPCVDYGDAIGSSHKIITKFVKPQLQTSKNLTTEVKYIYRTQVKEFISPPDVLRPLESDFSERRVEDAKLSQEDLRFITIMEEGIKIKANGHCEMPLPFKTDRPNLPDNKHVAAQGQGHYSETTIQFIERNFYVDDGLTSVATKDEAIRLVKEARELCSAGKLRIHKFVSNNHDVLASIPEEECADSVRNRDMALGGSQIERALGIKWCVVSDQFHFRVIVDERPLSRRGVLSTVASIYDPLGFVAPFILVEKQILQEMCRDKIGWDEPLSEDLKPRWESWLLDLKNLTDIKIQRCYLPEGFEKVERYELHHFSDASVKGFSSWTRLVKAIARLMRCVKEVKGLVSRTNEVTSLEERKEAELFIISTVQKEVFSEEIKDLKSKKEITRDGKNRLHKLNPFLDEMGVLRVGELLDDMTTDAFINALRTLIAIRGNVRQLRSDQGTNFAGARREFLESVKKMDQEGLKQLGCEFVMNPASASHMGGAWERQIRTIRSVLTSILDHSSKRLDTSSLRTYLYEVMAIINSRPLTTHLLNDPSSPQPLTPNHILTMKSSVVLPPPGEFVKEDLYLRKSWRKVQYLTSEFWTRWKREYLLNLQQRNKWHKTQRNAKINDIVILMDNSLPRNEWKLAKITKVYPSEDGVIRKLELLMSDAALDDQGKRVNKPVYLERPIHKTVTLLEAE
ncbi:hypothetical protein MHYP_G00062030 [Metynnis hypsauchen]